MPNPMTVPVMSTVMPNPMTTTNTVSSMGAQGLPMSNALPIIVNENTPNLAEIQSFPVIVSGGGIHMHQDPVSGQRYRMNDEFHSRIPQILADRQSGVNSNTDTTDSVTQYLNDLLTYTSKPENLVKEVPMETQSVVTINSKDILDSAIGITNIQNNGQTITATQPNRISISTNTNIPGLGSQQQKNELQKSLESQLNSRPQLFSRETSTSQTTIFTQKTMSSTNMFSPISQTQLQSITTTTKTNYPVNNFSVIGIPDSTQYQQTNIFIPTNSFGGITNNNISIQRNTNSILPTNKFYDT